MEPKKNPSETEFKLLALTFHERSGRDIAKLYEQSYGAPISMGTLYPTLRRLSLDGLITIRDDQDEDGRVSRYKITADGKAAYNSALDVVRSAESARTALRSRGVT